MPHMLTDETRRCIDECSNCHEICLETVNHCLEMSGQHAAAEHIKTLLDCAEACQTSANFMLRSSPLHPTTCAACTEACEACAKSCESLGDDDLIRRCAEECRRCAESCRKMAESRSGSASRA